MMPDPASTVFKGDMVTCSATGTPPTFVAMFRNSTVLGNATNTVKIILYEEGHYSCVASNKYGTDARVFSVILAGKTLHLLLFISNKYAYICAKTLNVKKLKRNMCEQNGLIF